MSAAPMREWLTRRLIRWADRGWAASYSAYMRCDQGELPWAWHRFWTRLAGRIDRFALRIARRIDKHNHWIGDEMVKHGWWG